MSFVKEFRKYEKEDFPESEYLTKIGVKDMFGQPINECTELVIDRENNYFLIPQGQTNPNRDYKEIGDYKVIIFYALCIDGIVLNMEVTQKSTGSICESDYQCIWNIEKINFPLDWNYNILSKDKLIEVIKEAFVTETYCEYLTLENVKSIVVNVSALVDEVHEEGEEL